MDDHGGLGASPSRSGGCPVVDHRQGPAAQVRGHRTGGTGRPGCWADTSSSAVRHQPARPRWTAASGPVRVGVERVRPCAAGPAPGGRCPRTPAWSSAGTATARGRATAGPAGRRWSTIDAENTCSPVPQVVDRQDEAVGPGADDEPVAAGPWGGRVTRAAALATRWVPGARAARRRCARARGCWSPRPPWPPPRCRRRRSSSRR